MILALCKNPDAMKALRQDFDRRLVAHGRKPGDLKILFMIIPLVAETDDDAREAGRRLAAKAHDKEEIEMRLWGISYASGGTIDYMKYDLDGPVPQEIGTGETTTARASDPARAAAFST